MADIIVLLIIFGLVAAAVCYIVKAKKSGQKCIGCPGASGCHGNCREGGCRD